jgi:hypothetical protein
MPAIRRTIKQLLYAIAILGAVSFFVFLVILPYFNFFQDEPIEPPPVRESIVIESVNAIPHEGTVDIVARIRNPNPRAGIPEYTLTFVLLDKEGNEIETISEKTYLLPGSLKYVAVLDIAITTELDRIRVDQPADPVFVDSAQSIPTFNSFLRARTFKNVGNRRVEVQKGIVTNTSNLGFRRVDVSGVAFDSQDNVVGVGKTFIGELQAGEQREFTIQWPKPFADTTKVIVLPDTNIYRKDNVVPVVGDPGRLREQIIEEDKPK